VYKIPEGWSGDKKLRLRVTDVSIESNWVHAMANAAGVANNGIVTSNEAPNVTLHYALNRRTGKLELQLPNDASSAVKNAVAAGLIAKEMTTTAQDVLVSVQSFTVKHRVYENYDGERWLDIVVRNEAASRQSYKLVCAVYLDGSNEANYINLPYYPEATAVRKTQTISLPVNALVDDPAKHHIAKVRISVVGEDERAYTDNEFDISFGGTNALRFIRQPQNVVAQEGEDVSFEVEVAGGREPYKYQWQVYNPEKKEWVDIPGFTDPVMARENIEKKWNGAHFRCVVTDAAGTKIVSQEVTLTVRDKVPTGDDSNLTLYLAVALLAILALWLTRRRMKAGQAR
jgi:LPXTG-motif cell wall-anchored protein